MTWRTVAALLWRGVAHRPLPLLGDIALALVQGLLTGAAVAALGHLVDRRSLGALLEWGGILLLQGACGQVRPLLSRVAQRGIREALSLELMEAAVRLPFEDYERRDVLTRLDRASGALGGDRVYQLLQTGLNLVTAGGQLVAVAAVVAGLSPWLAVPAVAAVGIQLWADAVRVRRRFALDVRTRGRQRFGEYLGGLLGDPSVNAEARVFGAARWLIARWKRVWEGLQAAQRTVAAAEMRRDALVRGSALAVYLGSLAYAVVLAQQGALSAGGVVALAAGVRAMQLATEEISYQLADAQGHGLHLADAAELVRRAQGQPEVLPAIRARERITLRDVHYRYPGAAREALRGATLQLRRGRLLALVGENGSGKTTLARVLLGLLPPSGGAVLGDGGEPLARGVVLQDFARYELSLRENVGLGRAAELREDTPIRTALAGGGTAALALAAAGLDALLGTAFAGGRELSGGQWQAVATARGIFARGDLIVLDEPTAALDPLAEREVFERFAELARGRFAVIVTHRMGAAALAAEVAVMRRGRVVEAGTHAELVGRGGLYARMWEAQARWYR